MIRSSYNSLAFFREYYHIPASVRLSWALVVETVDGRQETRLGIQLPDRPGLYLDVAMRRFFTETEIFHGRISRKAYPASRISGKDRYTFVAENGLSRDFPKSYIRDIYFTSVYSRDLLSQVLY